MTLEQIYEAAGVPPCAYPAERLLRLIDGLKAMDDATRLTTMRAIDAADDSWSIDDPQRDAAAKVAALERHAASIRAALAHAEQDRQARRQQLSRDSDQARALRPLQPLLGLGQCTSATAPALLHLRYCTLRDPGG